MAAIIATVGEADPICFTEGSPLELAIRAFEDYDRVGQLALQTCGSDFDTLAASLDRTEAKREAHLKAIKGRFNLFLVLLRTAHDETRLHTRFLLYLLNPHQKHDCGCLFLRLLIEELQRGDHVFDHTGQMVTPPFHDIGDSVSFDDPSTIRITAPFTDEGRPDILIELGKWGAIAIENKTRHGEQDRQLARYSSFLQETYRNKGENGVLVYLTPSGWPSETAEGQPYYRVSYETTILAWLEKCLRESYAFVNLNQALQQYRDVVFELTGKKQERDMAEIIDVVRHHPSIIRHLEQIRAAVDSLRNELDKRFWAELNQQLAQHERQFDLVRDDTRKGWLVGSHGVRVESNRCIVLLQRQEVDSYLYYIAVQPVEAEKNQWPDKMGELHTALKKAFQEAWPGGDDNERVGSNKWWQGGWCYLPFPDLSDGGLSEMLAKKARGEDVPTEKARQVAQDIVRFVDLVDKTWSNT